MNEALYENFSTKFHHSVHKRYLFLSDHQEIFKEEAALSVAGTEVLNQEDEWPSDDSKDDDYSLGISNPSFDMSVSTSLSWSLDHEVLSEFQKSEQDFMGYSYSGDEFTDADIVHGRRQRNAVDYKQLYNVSLSMNL